MGEPTARSKEHGSWLEPIAGVYARAVQVLGFGPVALVRRRRRTTLNPVFTRTNNHVSLPGVYEVTVMVTATDSRSSAVSADVPANDNYILVATNAPSELIASTWLTETDDPDGDVQYDTFLLGERFKISSKTPVTDLDFLPVDVSGTLSNYVLTIVGY